MAYATGFWKEMRGVGWIFLWAVREWCSLLISECLLFNNQQNKGWVLLSCLTTLLCVKRGKNTEYNRSLFRCLSETCLNERTWQKAVKNYKKTTLIGSKSSLNPGSAWKILLNPGVLGHVLALTESSPENTTPEWLAQKASSSEPLAPRTTSPELLALESPSPEFTSSRHH